MGVRRGEEQGVRRSVLFWRADDRRILQAVVHLAAAKAAERDLLRYADRCGKGRISRVCDASPKRAYGTGG
jgi:hypothetical protein